MSTNAVCALTDAERAEIINMLADINLDVSRAFRRCLQVKADYPLVAAFFKLSKETDVALKVATGEQHESDPVIIN